MTPNDPLLAKAVDWLLDNPLVGVRYLALRDLSGLPAGDTQVLEARRKAHQSGEIARVLTGMDPQGFWEEAGAGYRPKYRSTVWALILLAQLGARVEEDERIARGCDYLLEHALTHNGHFSTTGTPSTTIDCLQGNLCWALMELGVDPARLEKAYEWMARTVTGEGLAPKEEPNAPLHYYAYKCGPGFACGANYGQPCAWGAAKVMRALGSWPTERRSLLIEEAIMQGVEFLLSVDPASAAYPSGKNAKPSRNWWKFGFPVFYISDILEIAEGLAGLGYGNDPRLANALALIRSKRDAEGRWMLEYDYRGKTWGNFGARNQPNPWVTLRAARVLRATRG